MAFRELRDFTEIMRALGYPRRISVENFRTPNFPLVADCLYWMVQRYDPLVSLSSNIDTEDDRVEFLVSCAQIMASKARIMLKTKNLYSADGKAVKELLKIARTLYAATKAAETTKPEDQEEAEMQLSGNLADLKATRQIATEITDRGARLYDLLGNESELRVMRQKALKFLDAVASNLDSRAEHQYMERTIRDTIATAKENVTALEKQCVELKADETALQAKIKKKTSELERNEKRLTSLQHVRPAFMDEYEKLERELAEEYEIYLERFRNLDYLEHELDLFQQAEKEQLEASDRALKKLQKKLRDEELRMFIGDQNEGEEMTAVPQRNMGQAMRPHAAGAGGAPRRAGNVIGNMGGGTDDESSVSDSGSEMSDSDAEVSLGDSLSDSDSLSGSGSDLGSGDSLGSEGTSGSDPFDDGSSADDF